MDSGNAPSGDPFRRSSRVQRSPARRALSVPDYACVDTDDSDELPQIGRKRKENFSPPKAVPKRKVVAEDSNEEEVAGADVSGQAGGDDYKVKLRKIRDVSDDLTRWANSQYKSKKLNNVQLAEIKKGLNGIMALVAGLETDTAHMAGRLAERADIIGVLKTSAKTLETPRGISFAEVAKAPRVPKITGVSNRVQAPKVMFVRSADDKLDIDKVKEVIKSSIRPSQLGVNVRRVIKTARGVMIEAEGQDQLDKIKGCGQLAGQGLVFDKPTRKSPRVMIYDVEVPTNMDELIEDIYCQNLSGSGMELETFKKESKVVHTYKKKDPKDTRATLVLECSPEVRNIVRTRDRLYIGWQSCRVKDYNPVVRCYKCQQYGHVAKYCRNKSVCSHCAENHDIKECKNKNRPAKCSNCIMAKRAADHQLNDSKCPEYIRATRIAHEKVDYGH